MLKKHENGGNTIGLLATSTKLVTQSRRTRQSPLARGIRMNYDWVRWAVAINGYFDSRRSPIRQSGLLPVG